MRINLVSQPDDERPNKLFSTFGELLTLLLESRRPTTKHTYVPLPVAEQGILQFTRSGTTGSVGLLIGPIGIGKSSVLRYLNDFEWPKEGCDVVFANLAESNLARDLGKEFGTLPEALQRQRASIVAMDAICGLLRTKYDTYLQGHAEDVFNLIDLHEHSLLPPAARWKRDRAAYSDYLMTIEEEAPFRFWCCVLVQYLINTRKSHVKFVVDNIDDKNEVLIFQFLESLAHLQAHFHALATRSGNIELRFTPLVACRKHTWDKINKWVVTTERLGDGWFDIKDIHISAPCSIAKALMKRYEHDFDLLKKKGIVNSKPITLTIGRGEWSKKWVLPQDQLFGSLVGMIERAQQFDDVLALSNYNVASAMTHTLKVLANRTFIPVVDTFYAAIAHAQADAAPPDDLFTNTTMLRALAYGNQRSEYPIYPVENTVVHNLLESCATSFCDIIIEIANRRNACLGIPECA